MADEITVTQSTLGKSLEGTDFNGSTADTTPSTATPAAATPDTKEVKPAEAAPAAAETTGQDDTTEFSITKTATPATSASSGQPAAAADTKQVDWKEAIKNAKAEDIFAHLGVDEWGQKFIDYRKKGGDPLKYIAAKSIDWAKVSDEDVMKDEIRRQYPMFANDNDKLQKLYDREIYSKYKLSADADDADKEFGQILLQADAYKARQQRIGEASNFVIPEAKPQSETVPDIRPLYLENPYSKNLLQNKKVVADGGEEGYQFNFNVSDPKVLLDMWLDYDTSKQYLFDEKGNPNLPKQMLMSLVAVNDKFVVKSLIDYGRKLERKARLKEGQEGGEGEKKTDKIPGSADQPNWGNAKEGKVGNHL